MPAISVILPFYNAGKYLEEAVRSVLSQTYTDFELLIYDDGSTDGSESIIRQFNDPRIVYRRFETNQGLISMLNTGLLEAKGAFIARMDADDVCSPDRFQKQMDFMNQHPDHGVCGTQIKVIGTDEVIRRPVEDDDLRWWIFRGSPLAHPTVLIRKEILSNHGLTYNREAYLVEDFDLWWKLSFHTRMANIDEVLLSYRIHPDQESSKSEVQNRHLANSQREFVESLGLSASKYSPELIIRLLSKDIDFDDQNFARQFDFFTDLIHSDKAKAYFGPASIEKRALASNASFIANMNQYSSSLLKYLFNQSFRNSLREAHVSLISFVMKCLLKWKTRQ